MSHGGCHDSRMPNEGGATLTGRDCLMPAAWQSVFHAACGNYGHISNSLILFLLFYFFNTFPLTAYWPYGIEYHFVFPCHLPDILSIKFRSPT